MNGHFTENKLLAGGEHWAIVLLWEMSGHPIFDTNDLLAHKQNKIVTT